MIDLTLVQFIKWAHESFEWKAGKSLPINGHGVLALPPIQRNAAWGPRQVVDLWDSVLRGLPLGAFMLLRRKTGPGRSMGADAHNSDLPEGWDLLDGQQRLRSLLLGLYGPNLGPGTTDKRCLWIDLESRPASHLFQLYLTSASQPFGYNENGYKLLLDARRAARQRFEPVAKENHLTGEIRTNDRRAYNHELFDGFVANKPHYIWLSAKSKDRCHLKHIRAVSANFGPRPGRDRTRSDHLSGFQRKDSRAAA